MKIIELIIFAVIIISIIAIKLSADAFFRLHERHPLKHHPLKDEHTIHRVGVVINPSKNKYEEARAFIVEACQEANWPRPQFWETTIKDPGTAQTQAALEAGCDLIIACGGDGTVRKCAEELLHRDVPLGIVPIGTGNLFSRNVGINMAHQKTAVHDALFGAVQKVDVGHADIDHGAMREVWLVMTGMGADAAAIAKTRPALKKYFSWLAYLEAGVRSFSGPRDKVDITFDDRQTETIEVRSILGGNCGIVPGGIDFVPDSVIDDGKLEIIVLRPKYFIGWFDIGARILLQKPRKDKVFSVTSATKVKIEAAKPLEAEIDGDHIGMAQTMELRIDPSALMVKVPSR